MAAAVRSYMPIMLTMEVSLIRAISSLPMEGITFLMAWGMTMYHMVVPADSPRDRPASVCPTSTDRMPPRMFSDT